MNTVTENNPLSVMLDNAFSKFDRNHDNQLDASEYQSLYAMLKAGIATDQNGVPTISAAQYFQRMDQNADGQVSHDEVQTTPVLMPAALTDESQNAVISWLQQQQGSAAQLAAQFLATPDTSETTVSRNA